MGTILNTGILFNLRNRLKLVISNANVSINLKS
jgi:hypothetical protein